MLRAISALAASVGDEIMRALDVQVIDFGVEVIEVDALDDIKTGGFRCYDHSGSNSCGIDKGQRAIEHVPL